MNSEMLAMILYFVVVLAIGVYFFFKDKTVGNNGEKGYFLGGRQMNGWVAAFSAGASDMSAWVLMGLPGAIYVGGLGKIWISVGLLIGTVCAWIFVAPRLRRYSIIANDSITIPQFLTNRFLSPDKSLQIVSALVFMVAYCIYAASSLVACGKLFKVLLNLTDAQADWAMVISAAVIVAYTFLGGFNAVCWTDFFQGLLMLAALMLAPIVAMAFMVSPEFIHQPSAIPGPTFWSPFSGSGFTWSGIAVILSGLGWGLGYFGMPHILVRYISIRSEAEMKKSRVIGSMWTFIILLVATVVAIVGHYYFGNTLFDSKEMIFVEMVRSVFKALPFLGAVLLSAILAASMSTADSQLLASSSAFVSDVYKPVVRKGASDKEMLWVGRLVVVAICVIAYFIACSGNRSIMDLVECAWGAFGASFGPVILLALYWKRLTYAGAVAGIASGFVVDILWFTFLTGGGSVCLFDTGLYEIVPGFFCGMIVAMIVSLCSMEPDDVVCAMFDRAKQPVEEE